MLRDARGPGLYGRKHLTPQDNETVRIGTCLALRCFEACLMIVKILLPFWFEQLQHKEKSPSMFRLDEAQPLLDTEGVDFKKLVQCMLGARTMKPT